MGITIRLSSKGRTVVFKTMNLGSSPSKRASMESYKIMKKGDPLWVSKIADKYPTASRLELSMLMLREQRYTYAGIQRVLGNPSRKMIRDCILKYNPDLIDIDVLCMRLYDSPLPEFKKDYMSGDEGVAELQEYGIRGDVEEDVDDSMEINGYE